MTDTTSNPQPNDPSTTQPSEGTGGFQGGPTGPSYDQSQGQPYPGQPYGQPIYPQTGRTPMQGFFDWIRSLNLIRTSDRWFGGVAAGTAHKLGMAPWVMRLIFFLLIAAAGVSLWFYIIAWVLLPDQRTGSIPLQRLIT